MPDIDIDFQDTRRDEVIKYVEEKYGQDKVAQIYYFYNISIEECSKRIGENIAV